MPRGAARRLSLVLPRAQPDRFQVAGPAYRSSAGPGRPLHRAKPISCATASFPPGSRPDRISVVPNGFPSVDPAPARRDLRRDRFAFFGHINRFKGATVALEASAMLSKQGVAHALSLHGGTDHQTEQTLANFAAARAKAPDAQYRGSYRRTEIPNLIAGADWIVFPSEWWENAPLVINEAFQHWRPVICSALGGSLELVQNGINGLHFPVGDAAALATVMRRAIEEPGLWQCLVDGITAPVAIDDSASRHLDLYRDMLSVPARPMAA